MWILRILGMVANTALLLISIGGFLFSIVTAGVVYFITPFLMPWYLWLAIGIFLLILIRPIWNGMDMITEGFYTPFGQPDDVQNLK